MAQSSNESMNSPIIENAAAALSEDFNKLFDLHTYDFCHDITLLSQEKQEIKAHKFILTARCEHFRRIFGGNNKNFKETQTNEVKMEESADAVLILLRYLYSGKLSDVTVNVAYDLMKFASMYDLGKMKEMCARDLKLHIDAESSSLMVEIATMFEAEELKLAALEYISENVYSDKIEEFQKIGTKTKAVLFLNDYWSPKKRRLMPGCESISNDSISPTKQKVLQKLVSDMNNAYEKMHNETEEEEFFSDITVVAKGGEELKAHSYILAVRSEVLRFELISKLRGGTKFTMEDYDCDVVKALLKYIYTSKVKNRPNLLQGLLAAGHKYQLKELKDICEKWLINQIDEENFFDLVCFANKHKADQLKRKTLEYIERNKTTLSETSQLQWSKYIESPFIDEQLSHIATY